MSHSLGYGTSSGDLNTGGNLSESSFLEALFGLEFGHADDADFFAVHLSPITIYWSLFKNTGTANPLINSGDAVWVVYVFCS